jgi:protein tyrosine phosphatase (PTP) superfamily phosphohydrolase (DUF442 family)
MSFPDVRHFLAITDRIATSGFIPRTTFADIKDAGVTTVINLLPVGHAEALADEAEVVLSLGMTYHQIGVVFDEPRLQDFTRFTDLMNSLPALAAPNPTQAAGKIWVHCVANYRATSFVALYGRTHLGWSETKARDLARHFWEPNETWQDFAQLVLAAHGLGT